MKFLVTGCGRSGTHWFATFLQNFGLNIGHESMHEDGMVSWFAAADDPDAPHLHEDGGFRSVSAAQFDVVIHLVRHPLDCIRSWLGWGITDEQLAFVARHTRAKPDMPRLEWAALYWLDWNGLAEALTVECMVRTGLQPICVRIEDPLSIRRTWEEHRAFYGPEGAAWLLDRFDHALKATPDRTNQGRPDTPPVTFEQIAAITPFVAEAIRNRAAFYGYEVKDGEG